MGKSQKSKSNPGRHQANAPEYQQILQHQQSQQPPLNPYYPDPASVVATSQPPPPPYSSSHHTPPVVTSSSHSAAVFNPVPMSQLNNHNNISYQRVIHGQPSSHIVVQAPGIPYDYRADRHRRQVRRFNNQTMIFAILAVVSAMTAYDLFSSRNCISSFVVAKPSKDLEISIADVRDHHLRIAVASAVMFLFCLMKSCIGYSGKSHGCYLFLVGLLALGLALNTAYLAYLAFYSTCSANFEDLAKNSAKTFLSKFADTLPSPDKGVFGESNVIATAKQDPHGLVVFIMDAMNFVFYVSVFISSMTMC